jgi:hypothetical protein
MATPRHLPLGERLLILRATDKFREWHSLDDKRICVLCDKTFSGRQVEMTLDRFGHVELHCPTEGCKGGPGKWVYPGNPLVSEIAYRDWQRALEETQSDSASTQLSSAA